MLFLLSQRRSPSIFIIVGVLNSNFMSFSYSKGFNKLPKREKKDDNAFAYVYRFSIKALYLNFLLDNK